MSMRGIQGKRPLASRYVRIGQRLVAEALVTPAQLDEAVEIQRRSGNRLGSVLVELGHLDVDRLARCLGRWYGMPAALEEHFAHRDPSLQARLSPSLAAHYGAVPLNWLDADRRWVVLAVMDPLPAQAIEQLATELGHALVPVIAADRLVRQSLVRIYGVTPTGRAAEERMAPPLEHQDEDPDCEMEIHLARATRRLPRREDEETPEIHQEIEIDFDSDLAEDGGNPVTEDSGEITVRRRRLEDEPAPGSEDSALAALDQSAIPIAYPDNDSTRSTNPVAVRALGRIPLRRMPTNSPLEPGSVSTFVAAQTLEDVLRAIRRANSRDRIGDLTVGALRDHFEQVFDVAAILTLREHHAVGWKGFLRNGRDESVESLALPLRVPSAVADVHTSRRPYVGAPTGGGTEMDHRMWRVLQVEPPRLVAVAPLLLDTNVACILYAHTRVTSAQLVESLAASFTALAGAMAAALERLVRDSTR
jgi:hypothetical protein